MERRMVMMRQLSRDLNKLFSLCGSELEEVEPAPAASVYRLLEYVVADKALMAYLEALCAQTRLAINRAEAANQEYAQLLGALAQERLQSQQLLEKQKHQEKAGEHRQILVKELIDNADRLQLCLDGLCREEDGLAAQVAQQQLDRTWQMLRAIGVEPVEETGLFDCSKQMIVDTEYTPEENLVGSVAKTVRPGYRDNANLLRPQEVILYSAYMA